MMSVTALAVSTAAPNTCCSSFRKKGYLRREVLIELIPECTNWGVTPKQRLF